MIFGRLQWVSHNGFPIYSIDVHPEGKRFATGGGDHKVKIWNFELVLDDGPEGAVKLYAAMEGHGGPVNCVRFSPDGRFLATASDDHIVLVWELRGGPATPVFGADETNVENWGRSVTLSGHTTPVNDISWSPDGRRLVTCSLSSEVFVWDVFANSGRGALAAKLVGHTGFVKGVAWDPLNRFIATEADDKTVIIWRISDWDKEATLARPYRHSSSNCFFRRIGWSPDGSFLATVYGFNNTSHVAPILYRGAWGSSYCDFVGHKKPVVCAKFNPVLFVDAESKKGKRATLSYCAVGSQDCGLSVWSTETTRPKLVTKNVFTQSVLDIAWAPDGYTLLCCSTDGTAVSLHFDPKELGEAMSAQERSEMLKKLGAPPVDVLSALAEHPLQLQLEKEASLQQQQQQELPPSVPPQPATPKRISPTLLSSSTAAQTTSTTPATSAPGTPVHQTETRLPTGKRRITPQFLGSTYSSPRPVTPFTETSNSGSSLLSPAPASSRPSTPVRPTSTPSSITASTSSSASAPKSRLGHQAEPPQKKQRVDTVSSHETQAASRTSASNEKDKTGSKHKREQLAKASKDTTPKADKARDKNQGQQPQSKPRLSLKQGRSIPSTPASGSRASIDRLPRTKSLSGGSIGAHIHGGPLIPVPIMVPKITRHLHPPTYDSTSLAFLEVAVTITRENMHTSCVALKESGRTVWEDYIAGRVTAIAGNANFSAVGCEDGSLFVYSPAGRRMFPCIVLGSPITHLDSNLTRHLLVVTSDATLRIWDVQAQRITITGAIGPLLGGGLTLERVRVLLEGSACVATMSNSFSYVLHSQMGVWMRVADNSFSRSAFHSQLRLPTPEEKASGESLAELQTSTRALEDGADLNAMLEMSLAQQKAETLAHLEHQLAAALLLQSRHEYRYWLHTYARYLSTEALLTRLEELCASLLGPPSRSSVEAGPPSPTGELAWEPTVLGLNKRSLLREVLPIVAQNRACQRLTVQYEEYLRTILRREQHQQETSSSTVTSAHGAALAAAASPTTTITQPDEPGLSRRTVSSAMDVEEPTPLDALDGESAAH